MKMSGKGQERGRPELAYEMGTFCTSTSRFGPGARFKKGEGRNLLKLQLLGEFQMAGPGLER
jgi:hypothetical protein